MKQFDLQGNEYDCNIEFPTDITDVSFCFSKDALFKSWQDEALRHREEILQLKDQLQQKENIIKEAKKNNQYIIDVINDIEDGKRLIELLSKTNEILEKGGGKQ